ncbi:MAG: folylpolyglutamate synthase/dihydrofolate synthase family protein [Myxococcales bacterium]
MPALPGRAFDYTEATRYLYALAPRGVQLGLERMERALAQRGHPERAFRSLLVAGTNGKGSVAAMLAATLRASGLKVGLYTSPHLHRMVERFRVGGRPISERELARRVSALAPWLEHPDTPPLTFFEVCTLIAFELFRDQRCDVVVLEVGLGGRLDATNVVTPEVSVITCIAMDHADRLGSSIAKIAGEKAGIIKAKVPLVSAVRDPAALRVIRARARSKGAPLFQIGRDFEAQRGPRGYAVRVGDNELESVALPLAGDYQADNLACALAALDVLRRRGFALPEAALRRGLRAVRWPGRLELIAGAPSVLLDAAHNPDAARALADHLRSLRERYARVVLLFGVLADKDHQAMLELLLPQVDKVVFATPGTQRALPARELSARWGGLAVQDPLRALGRARRLAGKRGLVVAAGSIFLMSAVRAQLLNEPFDPPIAM